MKLQLTNIFDNYEEFLKRIESNNLKSELNDFFTFGYGFYYYYSFSIQKIESIIPILDYTESEKIKLLKYFKSPLTGGIANKVLFSKVKTSKSPYFQPIEMLTDPNMGIDEITILKCKQLFHDAARNKNFYHLSNIDNIDSILKYGLTNPLNYLSNGSVGNNLNTDEDSIYGFKYNDKTDTFYGKRFEITINANSLDLNKLFPDPEFSVIMNNEIEGMFSYHVARGLNPDYLYYRFIDMCDKYGMDNYEPFGWFLYDGTIKPSQFSNIRTE